jgi:hypothetical protein
LSFIRARRWGEIAAAAPCPHQRRRAPSAFVADIRAGRPFSGDIQVWPGKSRCLAAKASGEPDVSIYRRRGYFTRSPRDLFDRLKAAAIQFALIAILIAGFIMAALFAVDLLDIR